LQSLKDFEVGLLLEQTSKVALVGPWPGLYSKNERTRAAAVEMMPRMVNTVVSLVEVFV